MEITTNEQAKEVLKKWLEENHHAVTEVKDDAATFHFEVDYPLGTLKRQRVLQPKEYPGLIVLLNGVAIAADHIDKLKAMTEDEREGLYATVRKDLIFLKNSYDINLDEHGIAKTVQFSYEFYFDGLTKTRLYEGLLLNHRTLLYIVTMFNDQFGVPVMPKAEETYGNA